MYLCVHIHTIYLHVHVRLHILYMCAYMYMYAYIYCICAHTCTCKYMIYMYTMWIRYTCITVACWWQWLYVLQLVRMLCIPGRNFTTTWLTLSIRLMLTMSAKLLFAFSLLIASTWVSLTCVRISRCCINEKAMQGKLMLIVLLLTTSGDNSGCNWFDNRNPNYSLTDSFCVIVLGRFTFYFKWCVFHYDSSSLLKKSLYISCYSWSRNRFLI